MTERNQVTEWTEVTALEAGTYSAVCVEAVKTLTQAGAEAIRWTFQVEGRHLARVTPRTGPGAVYAHEVAAALGLGKRFRLSAAAGRPCVVVLRQNGAFLNVEDVLPA